MDFFETVNKRRATRKFTNEVVPSEVVETALDAALLAPNTSNIQPWEFIRIRSENIRSLAADACFSQSAAKTASELIVAVSRIDSWKKHRASILEQMRKTGKVPSSVAKYYNTVVPTSYIQDPFGILGVLKYVAFNGIGLFRPVPRGPKFRSELFETATKSTALACENFMLAVTAQGFDSCPMEGFDEKRIKKILNLRGLCHVVMVIGVGRADPSGIFGARIRVPSEMVIRSV